MNSVGEVRVFFSDPKRRFGFINDNGKDVFFHYEKGGKFICDGSNDPVFVKAVPNELATPKTGDRVLYEKVDSEKGARAKAWAYVSSFDEADKQVDQRPIYRLYKRSGFSRPGALYADSKARFTVLWEGQDIHDLRTQFPLSNPVFRIHNQDQSSLTIQYKDGDSWIDCADPR